MRLDKLKQLNKSNYTLRVSYNGNGIVHAARHSSSGWNTACNKWVTPIEASPSRGKECSKDATVTCTGCKLYAGARA